MGFAIVSKAYMVSSSSTRVLELTSMYAHLRYSALLEKRAKFNPFSKPD